jgi:FMN reductase
MAHSVRIVGIGGTTRIGSSSEIALRACLRGWPTPLGIGINCADGVFGADGEIIAPALASSLSVMAEQVVRFARRTRK